MSDQRAKLALSRPFFRRVAAPSPRVWGEGGKCVVIWKVMF